MSEKVDGCAADPAKLEAFLGRVVGDLGSAFGVVLTHLGDRLGLYRAMAGAGPLTPAELAEKTGTVERYVREWLVQQAAGGYVAYDPETRRYSLPPEQEVALTDENSPYFVAGGFQVTSAILMAEPRIREAFRTGEGMFWGEHHHELFQGTERFFRPGYIGHLVADWLPALPGVIEKLEADARVADIGCGHGASTLVMARAFPNSRFWGFDNHAPSIQRAREAAAEAGLSERVTFEVHAADAFPAGGYDLIAFFDCFHDLGDPSAAARRCASALAPDGAVMVVEPNAGEHVEDNLNPLGRLFAGASVLCCTPNALAYGGHALGTIPPDSAICNLWSEAGFGSVRRATQTPFNRIFEARL